MKLAKLIELLNPYLDLDLEALVLVDTGNVEPETVPVNGINIEIGVEGQVCVVTLLT